MADQPFHQPVLAQQCLELLRPALESSEAVMIDATLGLGGHTELVLSSLPNVTVVGIDRDENAIEFASQRLAKYGSRFQTFHGTYDQIPQVAKRWGKDGKVDAILMDLGVSSMQLDLGERGFSYVQDGPLDMRMDPSNPLSAATVVNTYSAAELTRILRDYGEEKLASRIARAICQQRDKKPLETTTELATVVQDAVPAPARRRGGNPAKRTFQAIRIAVNDELEILRLAVPRALQSLRVGGRLVVESYQSLEDRIVKRIFVDGASSDLPVDLPILAPQDQAKLQLLTKGAVKANPEEIARNSRSKSVRLRAVQVLAPWSER